MNTAITISIRINASTVFEDYIQQTEDESDADFLKRAAVVLEVLRIKSKAGPFYHE